MRHDAAYFREVGAHCRVLADEAIDGPVAKTLMQMAEDFDEEARLMEADDQPAES